VSTLAREALGGLLSTSAFCRCRRKSVKTRAARLLSRGAPGTDQKRVRVSPWRGMETIALPREPLGSTRCSSLCVARPPLSPSIRG